MQKQGNKIQNLIIKIGYTQQAVAKMVGYKQPSSLSKAIGLGKNFPHDKLKAFSRVLGVKVEFLRDNTYTYIHTDEIPEWAILPKDTPAPAPAPDPLAAVISEYIHRNARNLEDFAIEELASHMKDLTEQFKGVGEKLGSVVEELRLTREELKKNREAGDGEHDDDN